MKCPICFIENEEGVSTLVCGHMYHTECITKWINISNTCPICRKDVSTCSNVIRDVLSSHLSSDQLMSLIFSNYISEKLVVELFKYRRIGSHDISLLVSLGYVTDEWLISDIQEHFSYV